MSSAGKPPMSIGQVLNSLKAEFSDVSVSKIRFLESEGLISPERAPSGYRRFRPEDVERLELVLRLQRDSFLPLKVIKERLDAGLTDIPTASEPAPDAPPVAATPASSEPSLAAVPDPAPVAPQPKRDRLTDPVPDVRLDEGQLADEVALEVPQIRSLREFGVLCEHNDNGSTYFDHDDLTIATIARDLIKRGLEPRHMKTLRRIADQQADMLGQVVGPALRHKRREARQQAIESLGDLSELTGRLHEAFIAASLRSQFSEDH